MWLVVLALEVVNSRGWCGTTQQSVYTLFLSPNGCSFTQHPMAQRSKRPNLSERRRGLHWVQCVWRIGRFTKNSKKTSSNHRWHHVRHFCSTVLFAIRHFNSSLNCNVFFVISGAFWWLLVELAGSCWFHKKDVSIDSLRRLDVDVLS